MPFRRRLTAEPLIAYRNWRVRGEGKLHPPFWSVNSDDPAVHTWAEATARARCHSWFPFLHFARAPHGKCRCGLYGYHEPPPPVGVLHAVRGERPIPSHVCGHDVMLAGAVVCWGKIELYHHGVRAERMRVLAFQAPHESSRTERGWDRVGAAAMRYNVPLLPTGQLVDYAREFGSEAPVGMRPEVDS